MDSGMDRYTWARSRPNNSLQKNNNNKSKKKKKTEGGLNRPREQRIQIDSLRLPVLSFRTSHLNTFPRAACLNIPISAASHVLYHNQLTRHKIQNTGSSLLNNQTSSTLYCGPIHDQFKPSPRGLIPSLHTHINQALILSLPPLDRIATIPHFNNHQNFEAYKWTIVIIWFESYFPNP